MMRRLPLLSFALIVMGIVLSVSACGDDVPTASGERDARVILDWFVNADHAGIYSGLAGGHFAEQGVTLTASVPSDPAAALKEVATGRAEFAVSYQPEVLRARSEGIPVVAVAALVRSPLNSVIVRTDRGITRPRDLEDMTVGVTGLPTETALVRTMVAADGGDPDAVTLRTVGFDLSPAIAAGRVDAIAGAYWNIELPELLAREIPVEALRVEEWGVPNYSELVLVTSDDLVAEDPDLIRAVLAGLDAGHRALAADPSSAEAALLAANPDLEPEILAGQVAETAPLIAPEAEPTLVAAAGAGQPEPQWQEFADWMLSVELLDKEVEAAAAVTAEFLPEG